MFASKQKPSRPEAPVQRSARVERSCQQTPPPAMDRGGLAPDAAAVSTIMSHWSDGAAPSAGGAPLPAGVRARMEAAFGADFGAVRVHQGGAADAVGARAFARGDDLHFAPGQYDPSSEAGQRLLGHELAHVVQQRAGRVTGAQHKGGAAVNADPALEAEADAAGDRAARGERAWVTGAGAGLAARTAGAPMQLKSWRTRIDTSAEGLGELGREDQGPEIAGFIAGLPPAEKKRLSKLLSLGRRGRRGNSAAETRRRSAVRTALLGEITRQAAVGGSQAVTRDSLARFKGRIEGLSAEQLTEELYHLEWDGAEADEGGEEGDDRGGLTRRDERGAYLDPEEAQRGSGLARTGNGQAAAAGVEPRGDAIDAALLDAETIGSPWSMIRGVGDPPDRRPLGEGGNGIVQRIRLKDGRRAVAKRCTFMPSNTWSPNQPIAWLGLAGLEKEAALGSALQRVGGPGADNTTQFITAGLVRSRVPLFNDNMQPCDRRGVELPEGQAPPKREVNEAVVVFGLADGDLQHRLRDDGPLTPAQAQRALQRLAAALSALSKYGMTHGDIAPKNILIKDGEVLLHDLGEVTDRRGRLGVGGEQRGGGSSGYHAYGGDRELQERASGKMDVWSIGLITLDMLCGLNGHEGADARYAGLRRQEEVDAQLGLDFELVRERLAGSREDLATVHRLEGLVRRMVVLDPRQRAQAGTIAAALGGLQGLLQHRASGGGLNAQRGAVMSWMS